MSLILLPILYYTKYYNVASLSVFAFTFLLIFIFKKAKLTIAFSNFVSSSFCLSPILSRFLRYHFGADIINTGSMLPTLFGANLTVLLFLYLLNYVTLQCSRSQARLILILAVFVLSFLCFLKNPFAEAFGLILVAGVWYNAFFISSIKSRSDLNLIDFLVCQQPFYSVSMLPFPSLLSARLNSWQTGQPVRGTETTATYVKFLFIFLVWKVIKQLLLMQSSNAFIRAIVFPNEMAGAGLGSHINANLSLFENWSITLSAYLYTLVSSFTVLIPSILTLLMLGVSVKPEVDSPWRAKTLYQFYFRCHVNYSNVVNSMFIQPIYNLLYKLKYRKAITLVAFSFGIGTCGILYHYFSQIGRFSKSFSVTSTMASYLPYSVYWLGIGFFVAASVLLERGKILHNSNVAFSFARSVLYFFLASVLYILLQNYYLFRISMGERLHFMMFLFGINY